MATRKATALAVRKRKRHPNRSLTEAQTWLLLSSVENIRDDALRLGLSVGLRASEVVAIRTSEIDSERGLVKIWDEKKDKWRFVMPTLGSRERDQKVFAPSATATAVSFPDDDQVH